MLKKIGLPMFALAGLMAFGAPRAAEARVHFRIGIGAPVYTAPVYPYGYNYAPAPYVDPYYAPPAYVAPAPYVDPYVYGGFGYGGGYGHGYVRGYDRARGREEFRGGDRGRGRR